MNFLKYMFLVPHIKSMMYIPLNCAIIAQVYYESQSSHHLAIPRTRTQLYKALTHSLLVRHMQMKESKCEYTSLLPSGLSEENIKRFKTLAKFAFDTYHKGKSRNVTFFKEDIPEGLVHFGFMNESTEMYAGKGVERTFSFLHLSLQEYLAAWHLADSYSIGFQVAYHRLATCREEDLISFCSGNEFDNKEKKFLLPLLKQRRSSLVEPAIFLAGITGWRCQSEDDRNHWEIYLSRNTVGFGNASVLLRFLYEAQNPTLCSYYFTDHDYLRINFLIGSLEDDITYYYGTDPNPHTPYDCYSLSYCIANSSYQLWYFFSFGFNDDNDITLVETFVKGLHDHCLSTTPRVKHLEIKESSPSLLSQGILWLMKANFLGTVEEAIIHPIIISNYGAQRFLPHLVNLQSLIIKSIFLTPVTSWQWLGTLKSLTELKVFHISSSKECSPPPTDIHSWLERELIEGENKLTEVVLDIKFPSNTLYDPHSPTNVLVNSVLKSVLRSNQITKLVLPNISRETMVGVHSILLHCPSLTELELKRTRLGYDGILYICSALRNNTNLRCLLIHDYLQLPSLRRLHYKIHIISFTSIETVPLPGKTTCTDFLLELNNILKDNTTLKEVDIRSGLFLPLSGGEGGEMKIQSGLFLPLSVGGYREYYQWTGLGPLQQFNVGAVGSGMSPNLRRSFSSSDLTQPQTTLFWDRWFCHSSCQREVDFKKVFSKRKEKGKKFFLPSFTAPDTEVLQSFSGLDPRLKEGLEISDLHQYIKRLKRTCHGMLGNLAKHGQCSRRYAHHLQFQ